MNEDPRIGRFARLLVDYSLEVQPGDTVAVYATPLAAELVNAVSACVLERGAQPFPRIALRGAGETFFRHATPAHLARPHPFERLEARRMSKRLVIQSEYSTRPLAGVPPERLAQFLRSRDALRRIWKTRRWCLTLFPTPAYARDSGMSAAAFRDFVFRAVFADCADPAAEWRRIHARQERLIARLQGARQVRLRGRDTDLSFSIEGRSFTSCRGLTNMPDGEVFTCPVEGSAEGTVRYAWPVCFQGQEVRDVRLRFRAGRIVEARAARNEAFLNRVLDMDRGARGLGEFGIGTNPRIRTITRNILFDEKIGGTIHLAAGSGGNNRSALHWDMICDLRDGGEVSVDGRPLLRGGKLLL